MSTPEGRLTAAVIRRLKQLQKSEPIWWVKLHGGPMQRAGLPDILIVRNGHAIFLELKSETGRVSPLQAATLARLSRAGATTAVVRSLDDLEKVLIRE